MPFIEVDDETLDQALNKLDVLKVFNDFRKIDEEYAKESVAKYTDNMYSTYYDDSYYEEAANCLFDLIKKYGNNDIKTIHDTIKYNYDNYQNPDDDLKEEVDFVKKNFNLNDKQFNDLLKESERYNDYAFLEFYLEEISDAYEIANKEERETLEKLLNSCMGQFHLRWKLGDLKFTKNDDVWKVYICLEDKYELYQIKYYTEELIKLYKTSREILNKRKGVEYVNND